MPSQHETSQESQIQGILFCEFDAAIGPKIVYQVPENFMSAEKFQSLSAYIIPKQELQGRLITVNSLKLKILGFPVCIQESKYLRNNYIFNLCIVCDAGKRTVQYESLVKKLSRYLVELEEECNFLSNKESIKRLPDIMKEIQSQMNSHRFCNIDVTSSTTIRLKVARVHPDPRIVEDHEVPILASQKSIIESQWDLTTQQVFPYIDGHRHVAKIAVDADVEVSLVKACIQNMIYYRIVKLIPLFLYTNVYVTTPALVNLTPGSRLAQDCQKFVAKKESSLPHFRTIFQVYASMRHNVTVRQVMDKFVENSFDIDIKKLITFGLLHGLIRRLQKFPVLVKEDPSTILYQKGIYKYFDGNHSYDEICAIMSKGYRELDHFVKKHKEAIVLWK